MAPPRDISYAIVLLLNSTFLVTALMTPGHCVASAGLLALTCYTCCTQGFTAWINRPMSVFGEIVMSVAATDIVSRILWSSLTQDNIFDRFGLATWGLLCGLAVTVFVWQRATRMALHIQQAVGATTVDESNHTDIDCGIL